MTASANVAFGRALATAFAELGLAGVCLSPGSRNSPLTIAFVESATPNWVHHDERSAGFFALGLARTTGRPVALVCTSGTAAAEYHPAIVEASLSRVPLIVLTADRPAELRDVGAPQAIDQVKLYGDAVKWFHQGSVPDDTAVRRAPHLAAHSWGAAMEVPAGPVHLNLPFREPLIDDQTVNNVGGETVPPPPRVHIGAAALDPATAESLRTAVAGRRSLFVVGVMPQTAAEAIDVAAAELGAVVIADPQSGLRFGPATSTVLTTGDMLATAGALEAVPPEVVIRWGPIPTSKATWSWLERHRDIPQFVIDAGGHRDPVASAHMIVRSDPAATAATLGGADPAPQSWIERWRIWETDAATAIGVVLDDEPFPNEPAIAATVAAMAPPDSVLFAGSSMPIRDLDAFAGPRVTSVRVLANRGANGIDGSISTALGAAATGRPTIALIGDVAALHDVGALATAARLDLPLTIVVVHNDGGGIFHLLRQADPAAVDAHTFERMFGTPHGTDFVAVATAFGMDARIVKDRDDLAETVASPTARPRLLQIHTERHRIAPLRERIADAVRTVVNEPLTSPSAD